MCGVQDAQQAMYVRDAPAGAQAEEGGGQRGPSERIGQCVAGEPGHDVEGGCF